MKNNQNELQATLEKILASASEDYYIDYFKPDNYTPVSESPLFKVISPLDF